MKIAAIWLSGLAAAATAAACPLAARDGAVVASGAVQLAWRTEPARIKVGEPFRLLLTLCPANATLTALDATMPEHRHGMNYQAGLQPLGGGRWRADGLLWHMSGRWEWRFDLSDAAGAPLTLRQAVVLP